MENVALRVFVAALAVLSASCTSREAEYLDGVVLRDRDGCAFIAQNYLGNPVIIAFSRQESAPSCVFSK